MPARDPKQSCIALRRLRPAQRRLDEALTLKSEQQAICTLYSHMNDTHDIAALL